MIGSPAPVSKLEITIQEETSLSPFFEKIIDKKVNQVALNVFEYVVDFACHYLYSAYRERLYSLLKEVADFDGEYKVKDSEDTDALKAPKAKAIAQKVHHFADGTSLYDRTFAQRVAIDHSQLSLFDPASFNKVNIDQIIIDGKPVYFSTDPQAVILFGKNHETKEVFATDVKECPELVMIYERETTNNLKAWCVNTTQPTKRIQMGGQLVLDEKEIFIAQEIAPLAAPQPMVVTFP